MVFSSLLFLFCFLPVTFAVYYIAPVRLKNAVLLIASLVFYSWGEIRFFPVMIAVILVNYFAGLAIGRWEAEPARSAAPSCSCRSFSASRGSSSSSTAIS